jgi:hypothetical protein
MTPVQARLVKAYATLVMASVKTIEQVPATLKDWVIIEIAEREIAILETP